MVAMTMQQHGIGAIGLDFNRQIIHLGDGDDIAVVQVDFGKALSPLNGSNHIISGHGVAVVELDAFSNLEMPGALVHILIALSQIGLGLHLHIGAEQGIVGQQVHVRTGHSVMLGGGQGGSLAHGGDDDAVFVAAALAGIFFAAAVAGASGKEAQGHDARQQQADGTQIPLSHNVLTS